MSERLEKDLKDLRVNYPKAKVGEPDQYGQRLLTVPSVKLPKGWNRKETTIYIILPPGFPSVQPQRFFTPANVQLKHGGCPQNTAMGGTGFTGGNIAAGLLWWHWRICRPDSRHTLVQYVNAMRRRFSLAS